MKARIKSKSMSQSKSACLSASALWRLSTQTSQTHQLEIFFELVYYNWMSNKKIIQPFQLELLGDKGNW